MKYIHHMQERQYKPPFSHSYSNEVFYHAHAKDNTSVPRMDGLCTLSNQSCSLGSAIKTKHVKRVSCKCCSNGMLIQKSVLALLQIVHPQKKKILQIEGRRHTLGDEAPCSTACGMDLYLARWTGKQNKVNCHFLRTPEHTHLQTF